MQTLTIPSGNAVAVKPKAIPKHRADSLARSTLHAVERFFALPGVLRRLSTTKLDYPYERKMTRYVS